MLRAKRRTTESEESQSLHPHKENGTDGTVSQTSSRRGAGGGNMSWQGTTTSSVV